MEGKIVNLINVLGLPVRSLRKFDANYSSSLNYLSCEQVRGIPK